MSIENSNGSNLSNAEINFIMQQLGHITNLITKETSELNSEIKSLRREMNSEIQSLKIEMSGLAANFAAKDSMIRNIEDWKKDVSQIVTLNDLTEIKNHKILISNLQLKIDQQSVEISNLQNQHINDEIKSNQKFKEIDENIQDLNNFKIKAFTIFSVVQIIMTAALFWKEMFSK